MESMFIVLASTLSFVLNFPKSNSSASWKEAGLAEISSCCPANLSQLHEVLGWASLAILRRSVTTAQDAANPR